MQGSAFEKSKRRKETAKDLEYWQGIVDVWWYDLVADVRHGPLVHILLRTRG